MDGSRKAENTRLENTSDHVRATGQSETSPIHSEKTVTGGDRSGSMMSNKKVQSAMDVTPKIKTEKRDILKKDDEGVKFRYWVRILKGSALPLLYVFISILMLRKYVLEYPGYYGYNSMMLTIGFLLGLISMSGLTLYNVQRARKRMRKGIDLNGTFVLALYIPIVLVIVVIALVYGISTVWQFSVGFFITAAFPPVIVVLSEMILKGKFVVQEIETPRRSSRLVLVPNSAE